MKKNIDTCTSNPMTKIVDCTVDTKSLKEQLCSNGDSGSSENANLPDSHSYFLPNQSMPFKGPHHTHLGPSNATTPALLSFLVPTLAKRTRTNKQSPKDPVLLSESFFPSRIHSESFSQARLIRRKELACFLTFTKAVSLQRRELC